MAIPIGRFLELHWSDLALYKKCPRCLWLTFHQVFKRPEEPWPTGQTRLRAELMRRLESCRKHRSGLVPFLYQHPFLELPGRLAAPALMRVLRVGLEWEYPRLNASLSAKFDDCAFLRGKLVPLSHTIIGYEREEEPQIKKMQFQVWALLLQKGNYTASSSGYLFEYVPQPIRQPRYRSRHGSAVRFELRVVDWRKIKLQPRRAEQLFGQVVKFLRYESCPKKGCGWCRWVRTPKV